MNSYEHELTGANAVFSKVLDSSGNPCNAQTFQYTVGTTPDQSSFNYGQLIALSGDYVKQFGDYSSSAGSSGGVEPTYAPRIFAYTQSDCYKMDHFSVAWAIVEKIQEPYSFFDLAANNPEHFRGAPSISSSNAYTVDPTTDDSVNIYTTGHQYALKQAALAFTSQEDWVTAHAIDAFYTHFMTDMFSSGHMRVPRRLLHNGDALFDLAASKYMHDEDSIHGLYVLGGVPQFLNGNLTGVTPKVWKAFGDGYQCVINKGSVTSTTGLVQDTAGDTIANSDAMQMGATIQVQPPGSNPAGPVSVSNNSDNWTACLNAVTASVQDISSQASPTANTYPALQIKPEVYPPGATVYDDPTILPTDYTVQMVHTTDQPAGTLDVRWLIGASSSNQDVLVPDWALPAISSLILRTKAKVFDFHRSGPLPSSTPLYEINTTLTKQPAAGAATLGTQSFPFYIVANNTLYVRILQDSLGSKQADFNSSLLDQVNLYAQAEVQSPPFVTLSGQQQGQLP